MSCELWLPWVPRCSAVLQFRESARLYLGPSLHLAWKRSRQDAGETTGLVPPVSYRSRRSLLFFAQCLPKCYFLYFVCFLAASGGRVSLVPVIPAWEDPFCKSTARRKALLIYFPFSTQMDLHAEPREPVIAFLPISVGPPSLLFTLENATGFFCSILSKARPVASLPGTPSSTL